MKRLLISMAIAVVSLAAYAFQPYTAYCQVRADWRGNYYIAFDTQTTEAIKTGKGFTIKLGDESGNPVESKSCVDIINYLSKQGWKVTSMSTWSSGGEMNLNYFYLMEKMVENEAELSKGISLKAE